jgi:hypothetical protein
MAPLIIDMARPEGFEPPTAWFVARYSIQLSYGRAMFSGGETGIRTLDGGIPHTPLAGERLQPLGHLSIGARREVYTLIEANKSLLW